MSISVETTSSLGRKVTVVVPADELEEKFAKRIAELARTIKMDGYRPGKVPEAVVKDRYGKGVREEIIGDVVQHSLFNALKEKNLEPAGQPTVEDIKANKGEPLEYVVTFEVFPAITLTDFDTYKLDKTIADISEADIDYVADNILKQQAEWTITDKNAEEGDQLIIDFVGTMNGEAFKGGTAQGVELIIGSKRFIPGFEEGLLGAKAGEERNIDVTFPENYGEASLAGKAAQFAIKVIAVKTPILPEMTEEFIKRMGVSEGTVEAFRALVKSHMQRELERLLRQQVKAQLFDQLISNHPIELPRSLVDAEIEHLHKQMHQHAGEGEGEQPIEHEHHEHPELEPEARRRVTLSLLFKEIIQKHNLTPDVMKIRELISHAAQGFEDVEMVQNWLSNDKQSKLRFESMALEEQIVDLILEKANISEKTMSYSEIMKLPIDK